MRPVLEVLARVGPSDANILITGENGTGKGVIAQALHAVSVRAAQPFISVNMGGLPEGVFESELFGHVRGAFTDAKSDRAGRFELADSGTLFMDEICNIPLSQQAKILRTLETGEYERVGSSRTYHVNVRLISATNADVAAEVAAGKFRQDLLFRLNTISIHLPPLRERREDIPLLAKHFIEKFASSMNRTAPRLAPRTLELLLGYHWPGNVRELENAIERALLISREDDLPPEAFPFQVNPARPVYGQRLEDIERVHIEKILAETNWNLSRSARLLDIDRTTLYNKIRRYGLKEPDPNAVTAE
jgi:DNA-binding NtrC family response regulator